MARGFYEQSQIAFENNKFNLVNSYRDKDAFAESFDEINRLVTDVGIHKGWFKGHEDIMQRPARDRTNKEVEVVEKVLANSKDYQNALRIERGKSLTAVINQATSREDSSYAHHIFNKNKKDLQKQLSAKQKQIDQAKTELVQFKNGLTIVFQ